MRTNYIANSATGTSFADERFIFVRYRIAVGIEP